MKTKFNNPFIAEGKWYKGNLHTHTTNSDGRLSPEQAIKRYKHNGYDFLSITDHRYLTRVETKNILLIPGEELNCGKTELGTSFHLVALNIKREIGKDKCEKSGPQALINLVKRQGGEIILGHPYWSNLTSKDLFLLKGYLGIEVFNSDCFYHRDKGHSMVHWDMLLSKSRNIFGFATDDSHHPQDLESCPTDTCKAWIMVKAKELSVWAIMQSISQGLFYASFGPEIKNLKITRKKILVQTCPVKSISFVAPDGKGEMWTGIKRLLEKAEYKIRGNEEYIRVQCMDTKGRMAWTNPIFFRK